MTNQTSSREFIQAEELVYNRPDAESTMKKIGGSTNYLIDTTDAHATSISGNTSDISTNTGDISTNAGDITALENDSAAMSAWVPTITKSSGIATGEVSLGTPPTIITGRFVSQHNKLYILEIYVNAFAAGEFAAHGYVWIPLPAGVVLDTSSGIAYNSGWLPLQTSLNPISAMVPTETVTNTSKMRLAVSGQSGILNLSLMLQAT